MTFADGALRLIRSLISHPATSRIARYAARQATVEIVRAIQRGTRPNRGRHSNS